MRASRSLLFAGACLAALPFAGAADKPAARPDEPSQVSYYRDIRRIFQQNCQGCHQPAKAQGSFIMTSYATLLDKGESGEINSHSLVDYLLNPCLDDYRYQLR